MKKEKQEKPAPKAAPVKPVKKAKKKTAPNGKWVIRPSAGGFVFELRANNGEVMLVSNEYASLNGAKNGIATFKKSIEEGYFNIVRTKAGDFTFRLMNAQKRMLCVSSNYDSQASCESAVESTKRWGATDFIEVAEE